MRPGPEMCLIIPGPKACPELVEGFAPRFWALTWE